MEHPPKPAGSIDLSCLMEFGVYAAQSGDINNAAPPNALPDSGPDIKMGKRGRTGENILHNAARKQAVDISDCPCTRVKYLHQHADHNNRRDEMGNIRNRLDHFFKAHSRKGVEQQRQDDGQRK